MHVSPVDGGDMRPGGTSGEDVKTPLFHPVFLLSKNTRVQQLKHAHSFLSRN